MSSIDPDQQLNRLRDQSTWRSVWLPREQSQLRDGGVVNAQPFNNYRRSTHNRRAAQQSAGEPEWTVIYPSFLNYALTVTPDGRWVWQHLPASTGNLHSTGSRRGRTSHIHQPPNSSISGRMGHCSGPFFSPSSMDDLRTMEFSVIVLGIRRRFEEVMWLHNPTTNQTNRDPVMAEHHVTGLFEEIVDLQRLLRTRLVKDQRVWNCPHLPGQCPILGYGFLPASLNAASLSPAHEGQMNHPPRAYSAPPFTYLAPLPQYNGFLPPQSQGSFCQGNLRTSRPNEFFNSPSYPLLIHPHQAIQSLAPIILTNVSPTYAVDSFSTNGVDSVYHPPSPPMSPGEPHTTESFSNNGVVAEYQPPSPPSLPQMYVVDSFLNNGVDTGAYPPAPPPLPRELAETSNSEYGSDVQDSRQWGLRGPPYLADSVRFSSIYETAGDDPSNHFNFNADYVRFFEISPRLQVGPTCGLLALSLIGNLNRPMTVEKDILPLALRLGVTYQGEMFNAHEMALLAGELLGDFCEVGRLVGNPLKEHSDSIFYMLQNHTVLLVPYDNDVNNSPGLYQGRKAHWCVVVGSAQYRGQRFFCAAHGKSETLAFWREDVLARSNNQLFDVNPSLGIHQGCFKIGDLASELSGQIITLTFRPGNSLRTIYCPDTATMVEYFDNITKYLPSQLQF